MTKYQKLKELIERNNFTIKKEECYDGASGWNGCSYIICDGNKEIFDLSGNGYCFYDDKVDAAINAIEKYLEENNMTTFEAFKNWVDRVCKKNK